MTKRQAPANLAARLALTDEVEHLANRKPRKPARIVAKLDMQTEVARDTQAFLTRVCSGRWPMWRLLGMKRLGDTLFVSVKWLRCAHGRYSLVALSLDRIALRWRYFPTADAARLALARLNARHFPPHTPTAPTAPMAE